jgi:hypothetical protein
MKLRKFFYLSGMILTLSGCLMPWEIYGDFISIRTYGLKIYPRIEDNGGGILILLTIIIFLLTFRILKSIREPARLSTLVASILMAISLAFVVRWLIHHISYKFAIGAPILGTGLIITLIGSAIQLCVMILNSLQIVKLHKDGFCEKSTIR